MKKKFTLLALCIFIFSTGAISQQRHDGQNLSIDKKIIDAPGNERHLTKKASGHMLPVPYQKAASFYENFDLPTSNGSLPEGWTQKRTRTLTENPATDATFPRWFRLSASNTFQGDDPWQTYVYNGRGALATGYTSGSPDETADGIFTWAISPEFTILNETADVNLNYWVWFYNGDFDGETYYTRYHVMIKADGAWANLASIIGNNNNTNLYETQMKHELNNYKGKTVQLAFVYEYTDGWQMAIDEVYVGTVLENDFGISDMVIYPLHGILPDTPVEIAGEVFSAGSAAGTTTVSLLINGEVVQTQPTPELDANTEPVWIFFDWTPGQQGYYDIEIQLSDDDLEGNNRLVDQVFVYAYLNLAEDFENYEVDGLGDYVFTWPPQGWTVNDETYVFATQEWPIFETASTLISGRIGLPEKALITPPVTLTEKDQFVSFYLEGVNNNIFVDHEDAVPTGEQGYSTFQLKYSQNATGPWTSIGEAVEFKDVFDTNDNLLQSANAPRLVRVNISAMDRGTWYFAFTATSSFALVIGDDVYRSYVIIDNILIGDEVSVDTDDFMVDAEKRVLLYPNPAANRVIAQSASGIYRLEVFSVSGMQLYNQQVSNTQVEMDISSFDNGLYLVRIWSMDGVSTHKLKVIR
jgi:hypothetical protein